jgi:hypothetical protein
MSTTHFHFFASFAIGLTSALVGGLLVLGHKRGMSAVGRRRGVYGFMVKGFGRETALRLLIFGCLLLAIGEIGSVATG